MALKQLLICRFFVAVLLISFFSQAYTSVALASDADTSGSNKSAQQLQVAELSMKSLRLVGQQDLPGAALLLKQALEIDPSNTKLHFEYGIVLTLLEQNDKAIEQYQKVVELSKKAVELDQNNALAWTLLANSYLPVGDLQSATAALKKCLDLATESYKAEQTRETLQLLNSEDSQIGFKLGRANALEGQAALLSLNGDFSGAASAMNSACTLLPSLAWAHTDLGSFLLQAGQKDKAKEELLLAVKLDPNYSAAWEVLGTVYKQCGELKAAINAYETSLRLAPQAREAPVIKHLVDTLKDMESKINSSNSQAIALYIQANISMQQSKDPSVALPLLKQVCDLDPNCAAFHSEYGCALLESDQFDLAKEQCLKAIDLDKNCANAWRNLGTVYEIKGDFKDAIASIEKFLQLEPDGVNAEKARFHLNGLKEAIQLNLTSSDDYFAAITKNGGARWPDNKMPLKVYMESGDGVPGFKPQYQEILHQAFLDWSNASQGKISFVFINDKSNADITTKWSNDIKQAQTPAEGGDAICRGNKEECAMEHVDITILTLDPIPDLRLSDIIVGQVALHEIGHALGIRGHSPNPKDVMYFSTVSHSAKAVLSAADKKTLQLLYTKDLRPEWLRLFQEGQAAGASGDFIGCWNKGEAAIKLMPHDEQLNRKVFIEHLIRTDNDMGRTLVSSGHLTDAEPYFRRALDLEDIMSDEQLPSVLKNYASFLRATNRSAEINALEKKYSVKL